MYFENKRFVVFLFLGLFSLLNLSGCATFFTKQPKEGQEYLTWKARKQQLLALNNWDLTGSLGVNYQGKNDIVNFAWQQKNSDYSLDFHGPLHLGGANIIGDSNGVVLQKSATEIIRANSPEELLQSQFGWSLPVSSMYYWVRAIPSPKVVVKGSSFDQYNHLISLSQFGWRIRYADFKSINSMDLPTKIYMDSPNLHVKMVFQWDI